MQALILAGGEGKRLRPLTNDRPKGMVLLNGEPLLEYVFRELPDSVTDFVIVVGYHGEKIREHFGDAWNGKPLHYVEQKEQLGTWHAALLARELLNEKFVMVYGDDIGDKEALTEASQYDYALLVAEQEHPERFGVVEQNADGTLARIIEKPEHPSGNLVNSGGMVLLPESLERKMVKDERLGEYFLTDLLSEIAKERPVRVVKQQRWITVTYPADVATAEALLKKG